MCMGKQMEAYSIRGSGLAIEPTRAIEHGLSSVEWEASIFYKQVILWGF